MKALPTRLYRAEHVQALDRVAIEDLGIPGIELMERAGRAAFQSMRERWPDARRVAVFCGPGNNGGDGYVLARLCCESGLAVRVWQLGDPERIKGDAATARERLEATGVVPAAFTPEAVEAADVMVDALFGTGLSREVSGPWADAIELANGSGAPVLAIDIPSGLHADSGRVLGVAIRARLTTTFIGLKQGMFTGEGRECSGHIVFDDLDVPEAVYEGVRADAERLEPEAFEGLVPRRPRSAHKGHFGHVLVVGGDAGFSGAPRMVAEAAARAGAGLVTVATRAAHASSIGAGRPELMCRGVETPGELAPLLERASVVALGPGLGTSSWSWSMLEAMLAAEHPLVVDADGLNVLAESGYRVHKPTRAWILTPHPGEAARLLGWHSSDVQADRFAAIEALVDRFKGVVVLKGSGTLVLEPDGLPGICSEGNPGMASGGMGDVLTGIIAGLLAQKIPPAQAARAGVCVHARAGDLAALEGERGLLAMDLIPHLRRLLNP